MPRPILVFLIKEGKPGMAPLDPHNLTPANSMNRVRVMDLPNLHIDDEVKGKTGYELISAAALAKLIRQYSDDLKLDPTRSDAELCQQFDACFSGQDEVLAAAETIVQRLGRNLGTLLLTLKRGDAINREAREEWDDSYWEHWSTINQVYLGGGLVSGQLGKRIKPIALAIFEEAGLSDFKLEISKYGGNLPLVGAACRAVDEIEAAVVFDFGATLIKRGYALYNFRGQLEELRRFPPVPTEWERFAQAFPDPIDAAAAFFNHLITIMTDTWRQIRAADGAPARVIRASIAAYIQDGQPIPPQGGPYTQLRHLTNNLQSELTLQLAHRLGAVMDLQLIHDGTAAATAYAGTDNAAVITIGTALGVGFPPPAKDLRPISRGFWVMDF
jgi:hypothetical protein